MFNEAINNTHSYQDKFTETVKDGAFAKSFPVEVIDKILDEEHALQNAYDEGQQKVMQIDSLLSELRAMV